MTIESETWFAEARLTDSDGATSAVNFPSKASHGSHHDEVTARHHVRRIVDATHIAS